MKKATTTTTAENQNGTRQPQLYLASSGSAMNGMRIREARINPPWVPVSVHEVKKAR